MDFNKILENAASLAGVDLQEILSKAPKINPDDYLEYQCNVYNKEKGSLNKTDGIDCGKCLNKGYIAVLKDECLKMQECECMTKRKVMANIKSSGLGKLIEEKSFDNFRTTDKDDWRYIAKGRCMKYSESKGDEWLYVGGQSGCGKTHLCTAVCKRLIERGYVVKYYLWMDLVNEYNSSRYDNAKRMDFREKISAPEVIYIDDFLKTMGGGEERNDKPGDASLYLAYEIVSLRDNMKKKTIISSELLLGDIAKYDRAIAGRIIENTPPIYKILVNIDKEKDYRLK